MPPKPGLYQLAQAVARGEQKLKDLPEAQRTKVTRLTAAVGVEALRHVPAPPRTTTLGPGARVRRARE